MEELLRKYNVSPGWQVVIIGDGSGVGWDRGIGWAGVLLDRDLGHLSAVLGGQSNGTISQAEVMAFWAPLRFHREKLLNQVARRRPVQLDVFSDNESVVMVGNRLAQPHSSWSDIWAGAFTAIGADYDVRFHAVKDEIPIMVHSLVDQLSVSSREAVEMLGGENLPDLNTFLKLRP